MYVDKKDLEAYAKGFWRRWRGRAHAMAIEQSRHFETQRDREGKKVWQAVAAHIQVLSGKSGP